MKKFTSEMVDDYAAKLLFSLTAEENKMVLDEFDVVDKNIDIINEIEGLSEIEPMTHTLDDFAFQLRADEATVSIPVQEALRNAAKTEGRGIEIPKAVD